VRAPAVGLCIRRTLPGWERLWLSMPVKGDAAKTASEGHGAVEIFWARWVAELGVSRFRMPLLLMCGLCRGGAFSFVIILNAASLPYSRTMDLFLYSFN
jgi:hypothetical protein